jgi:hypothetical protein
MECGSEAKVNNAVQIAHDGKLVTDEYKHNQLGCVLPYFVHRLVNLKSSGHSRRELPVFGVKDSAGCQLCRRVCVNYAAGGGRLVVFGIFGAKSTRPR